MSPSIATPQQQPAPTQRRVPGPVTLDQLLARHRELVLQREYVPLGQVDYIYVLVKGSKESVLKMDYRKNGPRLAANQDTGDLLLLTPWVGLPDTRIADSDKPNWCTACKTTCPDCSGAGQKRCTLAGCAGTGWNTNVKVPCPDCLGGPEAKTKNDCAKCGGRGEVPDPVKCKGCDEQGMAQCSRCAGSGQVSTGRKAGSLSFDDPRCDKCKGERKLVRSERQPWENFVNGTVPAEGRQMVAIGPITRIVWHTLGENAKFQSFDVVPDADGNLMVLLLETAANGSRQYLVGGVPQFR